MSVQIGQHVERLVAARFISACLEQKLWLRVDDGDTRYPVSNYPGTILSDMFHCDDATLLVYAKQNSRKPLGWAKFIWGNSGYDCLSDYSTNLSDKIDMKAVEAFQDAMEFEYGGQ